ncbi:alanine racemase [Thermodesulfovibrio hydrogeniphilus]
MRELIAEIDLNGLVHNFLSIKSLLQKRNPSCKIIAIVKADAYGHGAIEVSHALESFNVYALGVAFFEEAVVLRKSGVKSKIIVLFDREVDGIFKYSLVPVIFDFKQAEILSKEASRRGVLLPVHIKLETGMGRLGIYDNPCETIKRIAEMKNIYIEGIMTHLPKAEDKEWTHEQLRKFEAIKKSLHEVGIKPIFHVSNSQGLAYENALFDAVRPGLMLYGYGFLDNLVPCMSVKTRLLDIRRLPKGTPISYGGTFVTKRDSLIGVVPVGYADGYFRSLSNKAEVLVRGKRAPVVGIVCMDLTMIDLTDVAEAKIDDEVTLIGRSGNEQITASDLAQWANTIPYEVLTSLGNRAKRIYKKEET